MNLTRYFEDSEIEFKGPNQRGFITLKECPFCGKINKMYVSVEDNEYGIGFFKCYSCDNRSKGNGVSKVASLLAVIENIEIREILSKYFKTNSSNNKTKREITLNLIEETRHKEKTLSNLVKNWKEVSLPPGTRVLTESDSRELEYLKSRGLSFDDAKLLRVMMMEAKTGNFKEDMFMERVIFPLHIGEKLYGYVARDITGNNKLKILNSSGPMTTEYLWNFNNIKNQEHIILTEGIFDAITCGVLNSCAVLGKTFLQNQGRLLLLKAINPKKITVFYDSGAFNDSVKTCEALAQSLPNCELRIAFDKPYTNIVINKKNVDFLNMLNIDYEVESKQIKIIPNEFRILKDSIKYYIDFLETKNSSDIKVKLKRISFYRDHRHRYNTLIELLNLMHLKDIKQEEIRLCKKWDYVDANKRGSDYVKTLITNAIEYIPGFNLSRL